jgi:gamma-glutamylcyclotransferase (GGCT)/AIG2-like uncharacterized protein YtfP
VKRQDGYLNLFVYGTLKRGFPNHDRYCRNPLDIRPASVIGRLYDLGSFPALEVPDDTILAHGTADPAADVATHARFAGKVPHQHHDLQAKAHTRPGWALVHGELMTFDDPDDRLPRLDGLEGFYPGEQGLYRRVLLPVTAVGTSLPAWVYVADEGLRNSFKQHIQFWP